MQEREILEVDVLIVGGGPAGLAAAYHLRQLNRDISIAVLEKGKEVGAHTISGAVMDPRGINELMPDWKEKGAPIEKPVEEDHVLYLTKTRKFGLPIFRHHSRIMGITSSRSTNSRAGSANKSRKAALTFFRDSPARI